MNNYSDLVELRDYLKFLMKHKRTIQSGITVSEGNHALSDLSCGVCEQIPDRLSYLYVDIVGAHGGSKFYPVDGIDGESPQQTYMRYKNNGKNMYGYDEYSQRRWAMIDMTLNKCNDALKQVEKE